MLPCSLPLRTDKTLLLLPGGKNRAKGRRKSRCERPRTGCSFVSSRLLARPQMSCYSSETTMGKDIKGRGRNFPRTATKTLSSLRQIRGSTDINFFSGTEIYFKGLEIYFSAAEIYFQATEIVLSKAATNFTCRGGGEYTMKRRKTNNETGKSQGSPLAEAQRQKRRERRCLTCGGGGGQTRCERQRRR